MAKENNATTNEEDDEVVEFEPDFSLKEKIGKDLSAKEIFTSEVVKDSQEVINRGKKDFLKWVDNDLRNLESSYDELAKNPAKGRDAALSIQRAAFSIKAQSGTFGFDLGSAIAKSLYDFLENDYVEGDTNHTTVIRKHIDTLNTIFHKNVAGDGGKVGNEVYSALGKLIRKFDH
jgi:chemotaxis protein histidine kinase CheA